MSRTVQYDINGNEIGNSGWPDDGEHVSLSASDCSPESIALQISNDISEGIDNDDSKENLRIAVKWWADYACEQSRLRAELEQKQKQKVWNAIKKLTNIL